MSNSYFQILSNGFPEIFPGTAVVAYDNHGNIFAMNKGMYKDIDLGEILYLPYDSFTFEALEISYSQLLKWINNVSDQELEENEWKCGKPLENGRIADFIIGKAAAYNRFIKQGSELSG